MRKFLLPYTITSVVSIAVFFCGCDTVQTRKPDGRCVGSENITQALAAIDANQNIRPVQASGRCTITLYEKGDKRSETPDVQLRFVPPYNIYFGGTILMQESFRLGLNDSQFWYRVKPMSEFYYGDRIYAQRCRDDELINPATLLEAMGIVSVDKTWEFKKGNYEDILTKNNDKGRPVKKIYVNHCSGLIGRIEYYDKSDIPDVTMVLGGYTFDDGLTVPTKIDIISRDLDGISLEIRFASVKLFEPTAAQLNGKLFKMPSKDGYEKIYKLDDDCRFIRE